MVTSDVDLQRPLRERWNRRPLDSASETKSSEQRWLAVSRHAIGERVPSGHFRPPRLRRSCPFGWFRSCG